MTNLNKINEEIEKTKEALSNARGSETEVYARIVGYYRSVRNWNKGKREEFNHRKMFEPTVREGINTVAQAESATMTSPDSVAIPAYLEMYTRKTCPNCPPISAYCSNLDMPVHAIDVDSAEGFARAKENDVRSAPTVLLFDNAGNEIARAHSVAELEVLTPALA